MAFDCVGVQLEFKGKGISETGYVKSFSRSDFNFNEGDDVVKVDPNYFRPTEVDLLVGDASKAKKKLGWEPKISLEEMINERMVQEDLNLIKRIIQVNEFNPINQARSLLEVIMVWLDQLV